VQITRGKINGPQKVVIYGPEGIGKTTFASEFPNPVFIDTEGSTRNIDVARLPKPTSWTMLMESVRYVKANPHICSTLVIDTADWAEQLCAVHVCATRLAPKGKDIINGIEDFGYGKGYTYLEEEFGRLLNLLEEVIEAGINVVFAAHAQMRKFEQPDEMGSYDRWELKLEKKTAPLVKEWADMILFANYKTYVVNVDGQGAAKGKNKAQGGSRVMYTTHHVCWDGKNRHNLPEEVEFKFASIAHCIPSGNTNIKTTQTTNPAKQAEPTYWHHPDPGCVFVVSPGETAPSDGSVMVDKATYETLKAKYESKTQQDIPAKPAESTKVESVTTEVINVDSLVASGVPKALADLMVENKVTIKEIQQVVSMRGYYPEDTPIINYDPSFISGVLVGAWTQVFKVILDNRAVPF
jgi:hypothetical protein